VSNYGLVWSCKTNQFVGFIFAGKYYIEPKHGHKLIPIDKIVYHLFKRDELGSDCVIHEDFDRTNDYEGNLFSGTRSDLKRHYWKGKKNRGVNKLTVKGKTYFRSILFVDGKHQTKYFKTRKEAQLDFIQRYEAKYGESYVR
jgi:hypothetical protein